MQEPAEWESALQLIIDVLMTSGNLMNPPAQPQYPHIPLLACNMDLQWMAEAWMPRFDLKILEAYIYFYPKLEFNFRFGHGAFLLCLEELYKKITGRDLVYTALIGKPSELTMYHADQMAQLQAKAIGSSDSVKRIYFVG